MIRIDRASFCTRHVSCSFVVGAHASHRGLDQLDQCKSLYDAHLVLFVMNPDLIGRVAIADRYISLLATEVLVNTNNCGASRVRFQGKSAAVPRATASCPLMDNGNISGSGVNWGNSRLECQHIQPGGQRHRTQVKHK
jgi:hypothetical protein